MNIGLSICADSSSCRNAIRPVRYLVVVGDCRGRVIPPAIVSMVHHCYAVRGIWSPIVDDSVEYQLGPQWA